MVSSAFLEICSCAELCRHFLCLGTVVVGVSDRDALEA